MLHSRGRIKLDDGSKLTVRPYLPKEKGLVDAGKPDLVLGGNSGSSDDWRATIIILAVLVVVVIPALYLSVREVAGLSPRCKLAAQLKDQIEAATTPGKP